MRYLPSIAVVVALLITALSGCDLTGLLPGDVVDFTVDQESYRAGESATLRLENNTIENVGYNLCLARLERKTEDSWQPVKQDKICTLHRSILKPGGTATYPEDLPDDLRQGQYRFRDKVTIGDHEKVITTGAFGIQ